MSCTYCYDLGHSLEKPIDDFPVIYAGSYWTSVYLFFYPAFILGTKQIFKHGKMQVRIGRIDCVFFGWTLFRSPRLFVRERKSLQYAQKIRPYLERLAEELESLEGVDPYEITVTRHGVYLLTNLTYNLKVVREKIPLEKEAALRAHLKSIAEALR